MGKYLGEVGNNTYKTDPKMGIHCLYNLQFKKKEIETRQVSLIRMSIFISWY